MGDRKASVTFRMQQGGKTYIDEQAAKHGTDRTGQIIAMLTVASRHEAEVRKEIARQKRDTP